MSEDASRRITCYGDPFVDLGFVTTPTATVCEDQVAAHCNPTLSKVWGFFGRFPRTNSMLIEYALAGNRILWLTPGL